MKSRTASLVTVLFISCFIPVASAQNEALDWLLEYLAIDTVNPPGNEIRGVEFFADIFDAEGIAYETAESAPGRGNIWARLEGGDEPALILLHHIDVVPASEEFWDSDPLVPVIRDGLIIGRGVADTKGLGILHLQAFLNLHRNNIRLNRDVIFMATADEEAGGFFGAGWLIENRPEIFENVGFVLNELTEPTLMENGTIQVGIEVAQKRPFWLRLVSEDIPGHGSAPRITSATTRLVAALDRIREQPFEPQVSDPVRSMFEQLAPFEDPRWQTAMANIDEAVQDPGFLRDFQEERPALHALLRNTCSLTMLSGSDKINVVPPTASAEMDCRILPEQDANEFLDQLRERIADEQIEIEQIMLFGPASSSADTELFASMTRVLQERMPGANVFPSVLQAFTDSHFFRDLGIVAYGFGPVVIPDGFSSNFHGNNERIPLEGFIQGEQIMNAVVRGFVEE
ncbi:MAG: peptidase M20 [Gammaproteobacteria bacterium]|nr:peptidase M20 [Gammaproteobacteria bacterium]